MVCFFGVVVKVSQCAFAYLIYQFVGFVLHRRPLLYIDIVLKDHWFYIFHLLKLFRDLQAIGREFDERRPQLENISERGEALRRSADQHESDRLHNQISSLCSLWQNVCRSLSTIMQSILGVIKQAESFDTLYKQLTDWLGNVESSVSRDLEDSFLSGPDDQADTVFQVSY